MKPALSKIAVRLSYVLFAVAAIGLLAHEFRHGAQAEKTALRNLSQASFRENPADFAAALDALARVSPERGELERAVARASGRHGVTRDTASAQRTLERLATQDSELGHRAQYELGRLLIAGSDAAGVKRGIELLETAATHGQHRASVVLGDYYTQLRDIPRAATYYTDAADSVAEASLALARLYDERRVAPPTSRARQDRIDQAIRLLEQHAREGHLSSMVKLAGLYERSVLDLVPQAQTAIERQVGADDSERVEAQDPVAALTSKELAASRYWYEKAVAADSDLARVRLAMLLRYRDGSPAARRQAMALLQQASGSTSALIELGKGYRDGLDAAPDPVKAFETFRIAAERQQPGGVFAVGRSYMEGMGVQQDYAVGLEWLHRAAKMGSPGAKFQIGLAHRRGTGVAQSDAEAVRWYREAAEQGNAAAMAAYSRELAKGRGVPVDPTAALYWADRAVSRGVRTPDLLTEVGRAYAQGDGLPQDIDKAQRYLELAARQEDSDAMILLGRLLALNRRAAPDVSIGWFRRAERSGNPNALAALGRAYASGFGVPLDEHKAFEYFHRASHLGSASAMREVGHAYAIGFGVQKSPPVAIDWYRKAAALGDTKAMLALSFCYASGTAVSASAEQAVSWLRKAADQGNASAQYRLGIAYMTGGDVPRDARQARHYLEAASAKDFAPAGRALKKLLGPVRSEPLKTASAETEDLEREWNP